MAIVDIALLVLTFAMVCAAFALGYADGHDMGRSMERTRAFDERMQRDRVERRDHLRLIRGGKR